MNIQLWFSQPTKSWRWTLTSAHDRSIMESGNSQELQVAMDDVTKTVKWLLDQQSNHFAHD